MKTVLYLDLPFHIKTKSSVFLLDMLKQYYIVHIYYYDSELRRIKGMRNILNEEYDFLICWQVMPEEFVLNELHYKKGILFPMYDNVARMPDEEWTRFDSFTIISFSRVLYEYLSTRGYCVKYIQYFPEVKPVINWGRKDSLFFWQRTDQIDSNLILMVCANLGLKKIHIHKALDPGHYFKKLKSEYSYDVEYTEWVEKREDLLEFIMQSSYYAAPRMYEGIGMSFLEAMALGRCIIAPDFPTMNEYIKNGETGLLYDYRNPASLEMPDIDRIQKNTYEYMSEGYLQWERECHRIIEWIEEKIPQEEKENKIEGISFTTIREDKFKAYFRLFNNWLALRNRGKLVSEYLVHFNILKIAIYGGGEAANRLIEELSGSSVEVVCIIDQNPERVRATLPVLKMDEAIPDVDAVVVTPIYLFGELFIDLIKKMECKIISLSEIVDSEFYD